MTTKLMNKILLIGAFLLAAVSFQLQAEAQVIDLPPLYECGATDENRLQYIGYSVDEEEIYLKRGNVNFKLKAAIVATESALKECQEKSSAPETCDVVACIENPV